MLRGGHYPAVLRNWILQENIRILPEILSTLVLLFPHNKKKLWSVDWKSLCKCSLWGANQQIQAKGNNKAQSWRCQITLGRAARHATSITWLDPDIAGWGCLPPELSSRRPHIKLWAATSDTGSSINLLCYLHFQLFDPKQRIDSKYESNSPLMPAQWLAQDELCQPVAFAHKARAFFTPVCKDKWACHKQS